jgi:hypothetical protein
MAPRASSEKSSYATRIYDDLSSRQSIRKSVMAFHAQIVSGRRGIGNLVTSIATIGSLKQNAGGMATVRIGAGEWRKQAITRQAAAPEQAKTQIPHVDKKPEQKGKRRSH